MAVRYSNGFLDRRAGKIVNLVSNSSFDTNTTGWTGSGATLSLDATGGVSGGSALKIANSGAAKGKAYTDVTTVVGSLYVVSAYLDIGDSSGVQLFIGTTADESSILSSDVITSGTITEHKFAFFATDTTTRITIQNDSTTSGQFVLADEVVCDAGYDGVRGIFRNMKFAIYTGTQPATANDSATGTLLGTADVGGNGLNLETNSTAGQTQKPSATTFEATYSAAGTVGWGRFYVDGESPSGSSTSFARIDVSIGTWVQDLTIGNVNAQVGAKGTFGALTFSETT